MRLIKSWHTGGALVVAGVFAMTATPALANDSSANDAQLEQRIAELEAQVERLQAQQQISATAQTNLEARIAAMPTAATGDDNSLSAYWHEGIRMDSADKRFKFKIGGRIQNDYAFYDADSKARTVYGSDKFQTGTEFRRARLYVAGTIYGNVGFKAQYDFAGGSAKFKDVYIQVKNDCIGTITVGHHYEPFGQEVQTSSKYMTFMERGFAGQIAPDRNTGISVGNSFMDDQWHWRVGAFRTSDAFGDDKHNLGAGEWDFSGRLSGIAWQNKDSDQTQLLAVGGSLSMRKPTDQVVNPAFARPLNDEFATVSADGAQHIAGAIANTGRFMVDNDSMWYGLDGALVMGQFHAMAEWIRQDWDLPVHDATFNAWGAQLGYFITGETRNWSGENWGRTAPKKNFGDEDGMGAWEAAIRYDTIDLNDGGISGGDVDQWTFGLNWYLNPNTRVMWNYALIDPEDGNIDVFEMRFQVDF